MSAAHRAEQGLEPRKKLTRNTVLLWAAAVLLFVGLPIAAVAAGGTGAPTCGQSGQCTTP